ncbi:MAG: 6-phosphofructokinase [Bacteroidota bacterium]|nr:6-phosphofructokinase [Bacteroidota bacterium]
MTKFKRIGILTSGGDAPGMNAAIRAVVRAGLSKNIKISGVIRGYDGLVNGEFREMTSRKVSNIIHRGGTILKSARSEAFRTKEGRYKAYRNLIEEGVESLIVIGGDGTFTGARVFGEEYDFPIVGIPGTIDNDLYGTDMTIGFDTAINTVVEAVDKIRDTASSHERLFFIEVMGKDAGFIALRSGIATGAEAIFIPEVQTELSDFESYLFNGSHQKKSSNIVLVAEGDETGGAFKLADQVKEKLPNYDMRVTILGHIQRGGSPSAYDRYIASRLGVAAIEALLDSQRSIMVGLKHKEIDHIPFAKTIKHHKEADKTLMALLKTLNF